MLCWGNLSLSQECPLFIFPIVLPLFVWLSLHRHCLRKCSPLGEAFLSHSLSDNLLSWSAWHHIHFCSSTQWRREEIDFYLFSLLELIYLFVLSEQNRNRYCDSSHNFFVKVFWMNSNVSKCLMIISLLIIPLWFFSLWSLCWPFRPLERTLIIHIASPVHICS